ncbi:hypothetical protein LZP69_08210 [Shewanella sp. AS1]|uniref:hypothetical protein n=1 Tax=Shewanella sp. AS1 TaxID=2907626 RepID=UPI001F20E3ED|nr:hypothetical protein [Shewanella sp. AS1]MCE9679156.1 hypothetical protein [Shewanella sp. AS1]
MKRLTGYPNWFFWLLSSTLLAVMLSGLYMLPWVAQFKLEWEMELWLEWGYRLPAVIIHVVSAWLLFMLLGALWHSHIRSGWRKKRNHISGMIQTLSLLLLGVTGVGLYYLGSEAGQLVASLLHSFVGLLLGVTFVWHYYHGLQLREAKIRVVTKARKIRHESAMRHEPLS